MATNQYRPDYAVPPGWVLAERLEAQGISHAEFARRCDRSAKLISEIVSGKAPIEPITAVQFERVLGVDAEIWLGIEKNYQLHQIREAEASEAEALAEWAKSFPLIELAKRGAIRTRSASREAYSELMAFFRVASIDAWHVKYGTANIAYRHSPSFKSDENSLATWLRLAEIDAEGQKCNEYDRSAFLGALRRIRRLTRAPFYEARDQTHELCNRAGVALSMIEPLPKASLSGAAWWLSPRKPVIALSARHRTDDHLWFSLFHEAAHILLHSKKDVFVDEANAGDADLETEANEWASNFLVSRPDWRRFVDEGSFTNLNIRKFAEDQGIAPGIVVGRLQHERRIGWDWLNDMKVRLEWVEN
ncbi:MAG: HigA family addiction module antitoxin [Gemmatimonadota bacterium]|nr:HigA family addiction module antitoxin [Gemmatimonadota bacterium]